MPDPFFTGTEDATRRWLLRSRRGFHNPHARYRLDEAPVLENATQRGRGMTRSGLIWHNADPGSFTRVSGLSELADVTLDGPGHHVLRAVADDQVPERPVNAIEGVRLHGRGDAADHGGGERDVIRVAVHEADALAVGTDLQDVAAEQGALALGALGPVQDRAAREVAAAADQRQRVGDPARLALPEDELGAVAHHPLAVVRVQVHGDAAQGLTPVHHRGV